MEENDLKGSNLESSEIMMSESPEAGNDISNNDKVPCFCSQRWILAYLNSIGLILSFSMRTNLSVAIICMVKPQHQNMTTEVQNSSLVINNLSLNSSDNVSEQTVGVGSFSEDSCTDVFGSADTDVDLLRGEFNWDKKTSSVLLAMYFYGYVIAMIPGGILCNRFGGKKLLLAGTAISGVCTLLTPVSARIHVYLFYVIRLIIGIGAGLSLPATHALWGKWAPPLERSKLSTTAWSGTTIGNIITFSLSGIMCVYGFDNGWGSIFYLIGGGCVLWSVVWMYVAAETPQQNKRITAIELTYIEKAFGYKTNVKNPPTPWRAMLTSKAFCACATAHICIAWTVYTLGTMLPIFMQEVLHFDIRENGLLSSLPSITNTLGGVISGHVADFVISRKLLSTIAARKIFQTLCFVVNSLCLVGVGFCSCHQRSLAVGLLVFGALFHGFARSGFQVNYLDFAPRFAGVTFAVGNTLAAIPGTFAPVVAGVLTPNNTQEEWRNVFYVCAGISLLGTVVFALFAKGTVQEWAKIADMELINKVCEDKRQNTPEPNTENILT